VITSNKIIVKVVLGFEYKLGSTDVIFKDNV